MIVLPVPDPGPDVTWIVMGFLLGFIWCGINTAAWWTEANRNDEQEYRLAALESAKAQVTRGEQAPAITTWLGIDITEDDMPATDEIPEQERPQPTPGPRTEPTEVAAVVAVTADDWLEAWRRDTDREMAEMRAKWDAA